MGGKWYVSELQGTAEVNNAEPKARSDVDAILGGVEGLSRLEVAGSRYDRLGGCTTQRVLAHLSAPATWRGGFECLGDGDEVLLQYPPRNHSVLLHREVRRARARGVCFTYLVHDLNGLRHRPGVAGAPAYRPALYSAEDRSMLLHADCVIVHNGRMADALRADGFVSDGARLVELGIFDYLLTGCEGGSWAEVGRDLPVVVAGNLKREKAGYAYRLPANVQFNLYGSNYDAGSAEGGNVTYHGSFSPEGLVGALSGSFGLVWDGDSPDTCEGAFGEYLRLNCPHKTSLYLAAGMPLVVWDQAAVAEFVINNGVGMVVSSIDEVAGRVASLTERQYGEMVAKARALGGRLRAGFYTRRAIVEAMGALGGDEAGA